MNRMRVVIRAAFLVTALAIVGSAMWSGPSYARQTECEEYGHTCHAVVNGQTLHLKELI